MDCGEFEAQLQRLLDTRANELDEVTAAHAAMCESCRALAAGYFQLAAIGRRSLPVAQETHLSIPLERRIIEAYRSERTQDRARRRWYVGLSTAGAIAAGLVVAFLGLRSIQGPDDGATAPGGSAIATSEATGTSPVDRRHRGGAGGLADNDAREEPASGAMAALSRLAIERFDVAVESGRNVALAWQRLTTAEPGEATAWPLSNVRWDWDQADLSSPDRDAPASSSDSSRPAAANGPRER